MSKGHEFLALVQERLLTRRQELGQLLQNSATAQSSPEQVKDVGDEALSAFMDKVQSSLEQTEIEELNRIQDALVRIEKGTYGLCLDCGDPISDKRLLHSPYVPRCIVCQEELENQE